MNVKGGLPAQGGKPDFGGKKMAKDSPTRDETGPQQWKCGVLTTESPGNSLVIMKPDYLSGFISKTPPYKPDF